MNHADTTRITRVPDLPPDLPERSRTRRIALGELPPLAKYQHARTTTRQVALEIVMMTKPESLVESTTRRARAARAAAPRPSYGKFALASAAITLACASVLAFLLPKDRIPERSDAVFRQGLAPAETSAAQSRYSTANISMTVAGQDQPRLPLPSPDSMRPGRVSVALPR
jgi:hypothetical protein